MSRLSGISKSYQSSLVTTDRDRIEFIIVRQPPISSRSGAESALLLARHYDFKKLIYHKTINIYHPFCIVCNKSGMEFCNRLGHISKVSKSKL